MLIRTNEYDLALVNFSLYSSSFLSIFYLLLMTRYVSLFGSTVSFASFTQRQWIPYQLIGIYCDSVKKNWELNTFLNLKIVIYKIIISFRLIGLNFFLVNVVDWDGCSWKILLLFPSFNYWFGHNWFLNLKWLCILMSLVGSLEEYSFDLSKSWFSKI